jgi:hypothetical protein
MRSSVAAPIPGEPGARFVAVAIVRSATVRTTPLAECDRPAADAVAQNRAAACGRMHKRRVGSRQPSQRCRSHAIGEASGALQSRIKAEATSVAAPARAAPTQMASGWDGRWSKRKRRRAPARCLLIVRSESGRRRRFSRVERRPVVRGAQLRRRRRVCWSWRRELPRSGRAGAFDLERRSGTRDLAHDDADASAATQTC